MWGKGRAACFPPISLKFYRPIYRSYSPHKNYEFSAFDFKTVKSSICLNFSVFKDDIITYNFYAIEKKSVIQSYNN